MAEHDSDRINQYLDFLKSKGVKGARYIDSTYVNGRIARHNFLTEGDRRITWLVGKEKTA